MSKRKSYFEYILNPIDLLRTKEVVHVNPTVPVERTVDHPTAITLTEYTKNEFLVLRPKNVDELVSMFTPEKNAWINIDGLNKTDVEFICDHFRIHPLIAEDIMSLGQRPKSDEIDEIYFCLLNMMYFDEQKGILELEQVSIALGKTFVITFQEDATRDVFQPLRDKLKMDNSKVRNYPIDFLFYILLDLIVDNYFVVMEKLADKIEDLEEEIIQNKSTTGSLSQINKLRKEMILLKRNISPVREIIGGILRSDTELVEERTEKYFKDVYDHIVQANELSENYRDMMMNLHDLYLNNVNMRMNEVMKVMAVVTCLMAPATVIGGIFGMNFESIPLLHNQWGFYISVLFMLCVPLLMLYVFRRRGWF